MISVVLASCAPGTSKRLSEITGTETKKTVLESAQTSSGELTSYGDRVPRRALWSIRWKTAELVYSQDGKAGGSMTDVEGDLFANGKKASRFRAQRGLASVKNRNLNLSGGVTIETSDPPGTLNCESVVWNPDTETIEAHGKVYVTMETIQFGPFDKLVVSPDLKEISTPGLASPKK